MLDLLVRRCEEQKDYVKSVLTNEYVKRSVVTRGITVKNVRATTEKSVSSLTQEIILNARRSIRTGIIPDSDLTKIAAKSQDRMDLFIECDIESDNKAVTAKSLQIIVENKIDGTVNCRSANDVHKVIENAELVLCQENGTENQDACPARAG